jgi:DNA-binding transcriptional LysR family regulator
MNDLEIKYFLGIVNNYLNFTKASRILYVSQPSLTKQINKLSEELGVKLFNTSNKLTTKLTPGGNMLYQFFTKCQEELKQTIVEAKSMNNMNIGELRMACAIGWDMSAITRKIDIFSNAYPNVAISFDSIGFKAMKNGLNSNAYDLIITAMALFEGEQNISKRELYSVPTILLYSINHPLVSKENKTILDFKDDILYTLPSDEMPLAKIKHEQYCREKGFVPRIKTLSPLDSIFLAVESGKGYTILDYLCRIKNNTAYRYFELDDYYIKIGAVWKTNNTNWALKTFLDTCLLLHKTAGKDVQNGAPRI